MKYLLLIVLAMGAFIALPASAAMIRAPEVKMLSVDGTMQKTFAVSPTTLIGGATVAVGDLGSDGIAEIIAANGFGSEPRVKIFRQDGTLITSFLAYAPNFLQGVRVAIADVDGDGANDIITAPGYGSEPRVRVFDGFGKLKSDFLAYKKSFHGGVFVTARDLDGDGRAEIITGAGQNGGPHVKVFDGWGNLKTEFFAFDANDESGVTVGAADVQGNGRPEILVGRASSDPPEIRIFSSQGQKISSLLAFEPTFAGGVTPVGFDTDGDGRDEILVGSNGGNGGIKIFQPDGTLVRTITPFESDFTGSISVAASLMKPDGTRALVVAPGRPLREGPIVPPQSIMVDLSEQRLSAYEHGVLIKSFLVSTGIKKYPTLPGVFRIEAKIPMMDYVWTYGPRNPDNYNIKNVKWNLRFAPHHYLHYAYWHHRFGHVMSHGCVNMDLVSSDWTYHWANIGTPMIIQN